MNTTHTTGPWSVGTLNNEQVRDAVAIYATGRSFPIVFDIFGGTLEECDANARLIAAAPDLLAALQGAMEPLYNWANQKNIGAEEWKRRCAVVDACQNAITKATKGAA